MDSKRQQYYNLQTTNKKEKESSRIFFIKNKKHKESHAPKITEINFNMKLTYCTIDFINNELYGEFQNKNPMVGPSKMNVLVKYKNQISDNPEGYIRYFDNEKENQTTKY